ncbi:hypothetical protein Vadar_020382 [Vaccinium darrowii]|uniref:Uncharacterized protein n=1 Tax=Vaccinium darrowii TaxID=229202 RepID=A0ACB7XSM3_9ERIC|nr:hypothetical protein Vadar_020382 [Vaccinium darrowii]
MATGIILATVLEISIVVAVWGKNSFGDFGSKFGDWRTKVTDNGQGLNLTLDRGSRAGVRSMSSYLFAKLDVHIKLIPGRSAGTLSTLGMGAQHEEIDFEFLGELSGRQYKLQTNVYTQGKGDKEVRFNLWFDPTTAYHTYTVLWNQWRIQEFHPEGSPFEYMANPRIFRAQGAQS